MITAEIAIDAAIICDDTRREINNKTLLIGVWPLDLAVAVFPAPVAFVLHVQGAVLRSGNVDPRLLIRDDLGGVLYDSRLVGQFEKGEFIKGRFSIDFDVQFQASRSSNLSFVMSLGAKEHLAATRRLDLAEKFRNEREVELRRQHSPENNNE